MKNNRCEAITMFGKTSSRCVCEIGHSGFHYFPNILVKLDDPERWKALQNRTTPYRVTIGELISSVFIDGENNPPQREKETK